MPKVAASIDSAEIAQFSRHAQEWWNPHGALRPLHKLNPARMEYIRDAVCGHYGHKLKADAKAFQGLAVLDIGCGGGLLCEPMARLGAQVTGLDASDEAIDAAKAHAVAGGLKIDYRADSAENFASAFAKASARQDGKKFDVITALEILEHVADIGSLLAAAAKMLKPGGLLILSTLNRTPKSFALGIVAAEYVLKWVSRGTHDWRKFIKPSELAAHLDKAGLSANDITGMIYDPFNGDFKLSAGHVGVNYLMSAVRR